MNIILHTIIINMNPPGKFKYCTLKFNEILTLARKYERMIVIRPVFVTKLSDIQSSLNNTFCFLVTKIKV